MAKKAQNRRNPVQKTETIAHAPRRTHTLPGDDTGKLPRNVKEGDGVEGKGAQPLVFKKRLRRQISQFDKESETLVRKNASRTLMLSKAKEIFDMAVDYATHAPTISDALTHPIRFEGEWSNFPKDKHDINSLDVEKLVFYGAPLSSLI